MAQSFTLIVAATLSNGIGYNGGLPWKLSREMAYFKRVTSGAPSGKHNLVLMGRNTWESIPTKFRPLAGRLNVVLSSRDIAIPPPKPNAPPTIHIKNLDALKEIKTDVDVHRRFLIGGAQLYQHLLNIGAVERILLTRVLSPAFEECDVTLPELGQLVELGWSKASHEMLETWVGGEVAAGVQEENGVQYEFELWERADKTS